MSKKLGKWLKRILDGVMIFLTQLLVPNWFLICNLIRESYLKPWLHTPYLQLRIFWYLFEIRKNTFEQGPKLHCKKWFQPVYWHLGRIL